MRAKHGQVFETFSNTKTHLRYHLVFSTKYRRKALSGIEQGAYRALLEVEQESDFKISEMAVDLGEHLHLLISFKPALSVQQGVHRIKALATHKLWDQHGQALKQHYWGTKKRLWSRGYYASTAGYARTATTRQYIRDQVN